MKKGLLISTTLAMLLGVGVAVGAHHENEVKPAKADTTKKLYIKPGIWNQGANERYYGWLFGGTSADKWYEFTGGSTYYSAEVASDYTKVIFLRSGPSMEPGWTKDTNYWNRTGDLTFGDNNCFEVKDWGYDQSTGDWSTYVEPSPSSQYTVKIGEEEPVVMTANPSDANERYMNSSHKFSKGDEIKFFKDGVALSVSPKEDNDVSATYAIEGGLKFAQAYEGDIYLNINSNMVWAGTFADGYYLAGVGGEWNPKLAVSAPKEEEGDCYTVQVTLAAGAEVKFIKPNHLVEGKFEWFNATEETVHTQSKVAYTIVSEGEGYGNLKVTNTGTYNLYFNPKGNQYYIENPSYVETHVLTIGGKNINMTKDGNQWKALGVALTAGDTVTAYTIDGVAETVTAQVVGNNNLDAAKKVLVSGTFDIYFHTDDNTLWISGLPMGGYHLYLNNNSVVQMTATDPFGNYQQFKTESVSFVSGDIIKILDANGEAGVSGPVVWAITKINADGLGANFEVAEGAIKCKTACSASVYLKILQDNDEIYFGARAEHVEKAVEYVNGFKSAMAGACSAENKESSVKAAWATQASTYKTLDKSIRDDLYEGGHSSVAEIREFGERYMAIQQQHADWELENFLEWKIPAGSYYSGLPEFDNNNNAFIVVAVIASITTLSTAVLLVIKKRKRQ